MLPWLFLCPFPAAALPPTTPVEHDCSVPEAVQATGAVPELGRLRCRLRMLEAELQQLRGELLARQAQLEAVLGSREAGVAANRCTAQVQEPAARIAPGRYAFPAADGGAGFARSADAPAAASAYAAAFQQLLHGDNAGALRQLRLLLRDYPSDPLAYRARFWLAELLLRAGEQTAALRELEQLDAGPLPDELRAPLARRLQRLREAGHDQ